MQAVVTKHTGRVGQPRLILEATPEKVSLQFKCGRCKRVLVVDPDHTVSMCVCRNVVKNADLLAMAEAAYKDIGDIICAIANDDGYLDKPDAEQEAERVVEDAPGDEAEATEEQDES